MIPILEAAKLAGVGAQAVRQWIKTGKIKGHKLTVVGLRKAWFVSKNEVLALLGKA